MTTEVPSNKFTKIYLLLWGICIFVGLLSLALYKFGYRLTNQLEPVKVGSIEITSNEDGLQIFLNNREQKVLPENGRYVLKNITPGLHSLVVSKEGFWPWAKTFEVAQNTVRKLYVFVLPMDGLQTKVLPANTAEYTSVLKSISQSPLPEPKPGSLPIAEGESLTSWLESNVPTRKLSVDKSTALYVEDNTVYVAWVSDSEPTPHYFCLENPCKFTIPVVVPNDPIKSVDFYKGRPDTIIFITGTTIYLIEVDREGTQNFQPLYKGNDPYFYQNESGTLYIKDGNSISKATL